MNNLQILGRLTRDPESRYSQNGKAVCQFSIAVNRNKDEADFFECVAWEKTAETITTYVKKGQRILIDGRLQQDRWKDQQSGENRSTVKIIVNRFDFIESADQNTNTPQQQPAQPQVPRNAPPMGAPGAYGQPPMPPYPGQYPQQQQGQQGYMQPPPGMPPMPPQSQQQGFWLGGNPPGAPQYGQPAPQQAPPGAAPFNVNQLGQQVPLDDHIPF